MADARLKDDVRDLDHNSFLRNAKGNVARRGSSSILNELTGGTALVDPNGTQVVAELVRLVGGNFVSGQPLLPHIWSQQLDNGGNIAIVDGELNLNTNGIADGRARIQSFRMARFITATFNIAHLAVAMPSSGATDVSRTWGCFDPIAGSPDGVYFQNLSGVISLKRVKAGAIEDDVALADFNGDADFVLNDNIHIYEIMYNAGTIFFLQDKKLIHRMSSPASSAYSTPHLRAGADIENLNGNTTNNQIVSRGFSISRIGSNAATADFFTIDGAGTSVIKNTPGRLHRIVITDKGTGASSLIVYNNTAGSGEIILEIDTADVQGTIEIETEFDVGCTVVVAGGQTKATVIFD